jgi:hypothetical protein
MGRRRSELMHGAMMYMGNLVWKRFGTSVTELDTS